MSTKKVIAVKDLLGHAVCVGDKVVARMPFPHTAQIVVGQVGKVTEKGVRLFGNKQVFNRFYKLADK